MVTCATRKLARGHVSPERKWKCFTFHPSGGQGRGRGETTALQSVFSSFPSDTTFFNGMFKNVDSATEIFGKLNLKWLLSSGCQGRERMGAGYGDEPGLHPLGSHAPHPHPSELQTT